MAKEGKDVYAGLDYPARGLDLSSGYGSQQAGTTVIGLNVRTYEPRSERARGGSREGLRKYLDTVVGTGGVIQHLNVIIDPTQDALLDADYVLGFGIGGANGDNGGGGGYPYPTGNGPWPDPPPGFTYDTSTAGDSTLWGTITVGSGVKSRNPGRLIPITGPGTVPTDGPGWRGGSGVQPGKNTRTRKRVPVITWNNPANITSGTPLSGLQLNAIATDPITSDVVPGVFTYNPIAGTVLAAGTHALSTIFYPTDFTRYTVNRAHTLINVLGGAGTITPILTPNAVVPDFSDGELIDRALNWTATDPSTMNPVAGTFVYTPAAGTHITSSNAPLLLIADFTPTDLSTYTTAQGAETLNLGGGS